MPVYINGIGSVSPQLPWKKGEWPGAFIGHTDDRLDCKEPDYSQYLDVRQLRRMSRIIKMGLAAGYDALREARLTVPDGIITGTSLGCLEDTGIFLSKMIDNREMALNPTPFIQSTHNTIGSQIALLLQCQGYNQTYTQRAFSFEHALIDAMMELEDNPDQSILTGSADEITTTSHAIMKRFNIFSGSSERAGLLKRSGRGTLNGEGVSYFVLSGHQGDGAVALESVNTRFKPDRKKSEELIRSSLSSLSPSDIDLVMVGSCGDLRYDANILSVVESVFPESSIGAFKHLSGEFPTATGTAMAWAARMIQSRMIPQSMIELDRKRLPANILIYNSYFGDYQSVIRLRSC